MLISELQISLTRKKGLNKVIRRLSTLRTWMLTLAFNILNCVYLWKKAGKKLTHDLTEEDSSQCFKILSQYTVKKTKIDWQRFEMFCLTENDKYYSLCYVLLFSCANKNFLFWRLSNDSQIVFRTDIFRKLKLGAPENGHCIWLELASIFLSLIFEKTLQMVKKLLKDDRVQVCLLSYLSKKLLIFS